MLDVLSCHRFGGGVGGVRGAGGCGTMRVILAFVAVVGSGRFSLPFLLKLFDRPVKRGGWREGAAARFGHFYNCFLDRRL